MTTPAKFNAPRTPPYKLAAVGMLVIAALIFYLVYGQFRGNFTPKTKLTMVAPRAGLVMDPGAKVTYDGVEIGRVGNISETLAPDGKPAAKFTLDVYPRYLALIPENVNAQIKATTNSRIDFGFALTHYQGKLPKRLIDTGGLAKKDRITHRIELSSTTEIDADLKKWLKTAYDLDG